METLRSATANKLLRHMRILSVHCDEDNIFRGAFRLSITLINNLAKNIWVRPTLGHKAQ